MVLSPAPPPAPAALAADAGRRLRPGLRTSVLFGSGIVIIALAVAIAVNVADHLRNNAVDSALGNVASIVRGYVDPIFSERTLGIDAAADPDVQAQLERLVAAGDMRRINVFTRDGRILYSTEASLRDRRLSIDDPLARAFSGRPVTEFGTRDGAEGTAARLPEDYLEIYVPIHGMTDGSPIGVFEVYVDARPIEDSVAQTRADVFLIAMAAGAALLGLLWLAFGGASRRLAMQNRRLTGLNDRLNEVSDDLRQREARFRSLVQNSSDVVVVIGTDGLVSYESDAVSGVLGIDPADRIGRPFDEHLHPDDAGWVASVLASAPSLEGRQQSAQLRMRHADGSWRWVEAVAQDRAHDPAVGGMVLNFRDVTDRRRLQDQLQHEAFHDPLTGLANRALFSDRVTHALARASRGPADRVAVLFADLDDFKLVNDSLGHAAGDELLRSVGERILACLRQQDTAARLGGDEFAILVEDADAETADEIARRILDALRQPFAMATRQIFVQASIGTALGGGLGSPVSAEELLRNADAAMYTAKSRGKGRHAFYEPHMHQLAMHRLELRERLEAALEAREFVLQYQPVVDLATLEVAGVEALVRWRQPNGRLAPPGEFIGLAEETGLIVPLGLWVLEEACRQAVAWSSLPGRPITMAINVAPRQLQEASFTAQLAATIARTGVQPANIVLELTESALLDDGDITAQSIAGMKSVGVRIALDDFGTGFSSLSHLRRFPIDVLKIDRSFVDGVDGTDEGERALVRSIVRLAHSLALETVAEGVERPLQLVRLRQLGAQFGQGFHFAEPMDAGALEALLRKRARIAG
jgi:diguanylate cyclase (GGDEF)-like protein/PAS domain S-box-containing protein